MWYVVQVTTGQEAKVCELIKATVRASLAGEAAEDNDAEPPEHPRVLRECFVPQFQAERKFRGQYRISNMQLFPGYVIAISNDVGQLNQMLRRVSAFTRILGNGNAFTPLDRAEMQFIDSFTTQDNRVIKASHAIVEGDVVTVIEGPLVGHETWIKSINRRKGTATIEFEMLGRTKTVEVGLSTVSKRPGTYIGAKQE